MPTFYHGRHILTGSLKLVTHSSGLAGLIELPGARKWGLHPLRFEMNCNLFRALLFGQLRERKRQRGKEREVDGDGFKTIEYGGEYVYWKKRVREEKTCAIMSESEMVELMCFGLLVCMDSWVLGQRQLTGQMSCIKELFWMSLKY